MSVAQGSGSYGYTGREARASSVSRPDWTVRNVRLPEAAPTLGRPWDVPSSVEAPSSLAL